MKQQKVGKYLKVGICHEGKMSKQFIHRMVAEVYHLNPKGLPVVNHLDGNKLNNHVSNLEWCTQGDNQKHSYKLGLRDMRGSKHHRSIFTEEDVQEIRLLRTEGSSYKELASRYACSETAIRDIVKRRRWAHVE
ncbi:HNH endonuclease [Bacillus cereus]|uniref:HNH endonuclease n=1 Tax=Bacillus cereus TaxID=1396 RepID=UPI0018F3A013|nr:HNH endonuclease [Bacillus cereus]MBJ8023712.1 HNH endonuclease [Bacillus cereus]